MNNLFTRLFPRQFVFQYTTAVELYVKMKYSKILILPRKQLLRSTTKRLPRDSDGMKVSVPFFYGKTRAAKDIQEARVVVVAMQPLHLLHKKKRYHNYSNYCKLTDFQNTVTINVFILYRKERTSIQYNITPAHQKGSQTKRVRVPQLAIKLKNKNEKRLEK